MCKKISRLLHTCLFYVHFSIIYACGPNCPVDETRACTFSFEFFREQEVQVTGDKANIQLCVETLDKHHVIVHLSLSSAVSSRVIVCSLPPKWRVATVRSYQFSALWFWLCTSVGYGTTSRFQSTGYVCTAKNAPEELRHDFTSAKTHPKRAVSRFVERYSERKFKLLHYSIEMTCE